MTAALRSSHVSKAAAALAAGLGLVLVTPGVAQAKFGALTTNLANALTAGVVSAPTSPSSSPVGNNVSMSWTSPNNANSNGYRVIGLSNGVNSSCSSAESSYNLAIANAALASNTLASATDTGRGSGGTPSGANAGNYFCYRIESTYSKSNPGSTTASWFSVGTTPLAVQVGFVASTITLSNNTGSATCGTTTSGTVGKLDCNDQIVITFNQPIDPSKKPSNTDTVCAFSKTTGGTTTQAVNLASTTATGNCGAGETVDVGTFSNPSVDSGTNSRFNATYVLSASNKTLTITIGQGTSNPLKSPIGASGTTLAPSATLIATPSTAGTISLCTGSVTGSNCTPTISGAF